MIKRKETVEDLLAKFMDGRSSREEEQQLADYFRETDVPDEWLPYREMFAYFDKGMPDEHLSVQSIRRKPLLHRIWWVVGSAAAVLAVLLLFLPKGNDEANGTIAMQAGTEKLRIVSDSLTKKIKIAPAKLMGKPTPKYNRLMQERLVRRPPKRYFAKASEPIVTTTIPVDTAKTDSVRPPADGILIAQVQKTDTMHDITPHKKVSGTENFTTHVEPTKEDILMAIIREQMKRAEMLQTFERMVMESQLSATDDDNTEL